MAFNALFASLPSCAGSCSVCLRRDSGSGAGVVLLWCGLHRVCDRATCWRRFSACRRVRFVRARTGPPRVVLRVADEMVCGAEECGICVLEAIARGPRVRRQVFVRAALSRVLHGRDAIGGEFTVTPRVEGVPVARRRRRQRSRAATQLPAPPPPPPPPPLPPLPPIPSVDDRGDDSGQDSGQDSGELVGTPRVHVEGGWTIYTPPRMD